MKNILLLLFGILFVYSSCGSSDKETANQLRESHACKDLIEEIENRSDVVKAIVSDGLGLCVVMIPELGNPKSTALYFIRMANNRGVSVKFCKIVSAYDYSWGKWYMSGEKMAFESNSDYQ